MCKDGVSVPRRLHVLVAEAFIGPRPDGLEVHHIDHDRMNPRVDNLEYVTHQENVALAHKHHHKEYWEYVLPTLPLYLARLAERD